MHAHTYIYKSIYVCTYTYTCTYAYACTENDEKHTHIYIYMVRPPKPTFYIVFDMMLLIMGAGSTKGQAQ